MYKKTLKYAQAMLLSSQSASQLFSSNDLSILGKDAFRSYLFISIFLNWRKRRLRLQYSLVNILVSEEPESEYSSKKIPPRTMTVISYMCKKSDCKWIDCRERTKRCSHNEAVETKAGAGTPTPFTKCIDATILRESVNADVSV